MLKYGLFAALFLLIAACLYAAYLWYEVRRSINTSRILIAQAKPYEQHPPAPNARILVAGDSTAVGVGAESSTSIAGRLGKDFPRADIANIGVSGLRLQGLRERLAAQKGRYDLVVLQIGANDITGRTSYADIRTELNAVLEQAVARGTEVLLLTAGNVGLSPTFHWPLSAYITARTRAVRSIFMEEIGKRAEAAYVDLFEEREDDAFSRDVPRYYASDRFHPSGEGYGLWYEKVRSQLDI